MTSFGENDIEWKTKEANRALSFGATIRSIGVGSDGPDQEETQLWNEEDFSVVSVGSEKQSWYFSKCVLVDDQSFLTSGFTCKRISYFVT